MTTKKPSDKKISGVGSLRRATEVESADSVGSVDSVKAATAVSGVSRVGAVEGKRRATRIMTSEERAQLLRMVHEEADKLFEDGTLPASQKEVVKSAVLMAVDSSIIVEDKPEDGTPPATTKPTQK